MGHGARNLGARLGFGFPGDSEGLVGRTVVAAMVGGLSSKITGGTFANGEMTATFVHLFNAEDVNDDDISGFENSSALDDFVKIFRLDLMDGDSAGVIRISVGSVANVGSGGRFEGVGAP